MTALAMVPEMAYVGAPWMLGFIYSISAAKKIFSRHPLFGAGALYPQWFAPVAGVTEFATVGLLHFDRPLALLGSCVFLGGVLHTNAHPKGPVARHGALALLPAALCGGLTALLLLAPGASTSAMAPQLGTLPLWLYGGAVAVGFLTGTALGSLMPKTPKAE